MLPPDMINCFCSRDWGLQPVRSLLNSENPILRIALAEMIHCLCIIPGIDADPGEIEHFIGWMHPLFGHEHGKLF
jgi:hypothetical protein